MTNAEFHAVVVVERERNRRNPDIAARTAEWLASEDELCHPLTADEQLAVIRRQRCSACNRPVLPARGQPLWYCTLLGWRCPDCRPPADAPFFATLRPLVPGTDPTSVL